MLLYKPKPLILVTLISAVTTSAFVMNTPFLQRQHEPLTSAYMSDSDSTSLPSLDPKETAVVLIEYQNEFTTDGGALFGAVKDCMEATGTLQNSKALVDQARDAGCTIVHVPIVFDEGHSEISKRPYGILTGIKEGEIFKAGTWGADFCYTMKPQPGDIVASGKRGLCGFATTNLDFILRQNECKNIVLAGFLTNCCVESTMRSGYELGYKVYTVKDCCAATSVDAQNAAYEHNFGMFSLPTTSTEILQSIKSPAVSY